MSHDAIYRKKTRDQNALRAKRSFPTYNGWARRTAGSSLGARWKISGAASFENRAESGDAGSMFPKRLSWTMGLGSWDFTESERCKGAAIYINSNLTRGLRNVHAVLHPARAAYADEVARATNVVARERRGGDESPARQSSKKRLSII